jgi:hypothetical protein
MRNDRLSDHADHGSGINCEDKIVLKQVLLLAMAIFFMMAPTPDANDIANISANFIGPVNGLSLHGFNAGE